MFNQAILMGRVGKQETRQLNNGGDVTNVSLVTSKKGTNKAGEKFEKVVWHNISFYSKLSEIVQKYVNIGDIIQICGEIDNQKYTGKDGIERIKSYIIAHSLTMVPRGTKEYKQPEPEQAEVDAFAEDFKDDFIPF